MNYIAGFFLCFLKSEPEAYQFYHQILLEMGEIFNDKFLHLQGYFYVLENLIKIFLPKLAHHFKNIGMQPIFYCSSWFITLFTQALHYTPQSFLLIQVVDLFMAEGYKGFFKAVLAILTFKEKELLESNFEEGVEILGKVMESELFRNTNYEQFRNLQKKSMPAQDIKKIVTFYEEYCFVSNFKAICKQIRIKSSLIQKFETRYRKISSRI